MDQGFSPSEMASDLEDKVRGMIAFLAVGDALGSSHEFKYQQNIKYTGKIEHVPFVWNRFQGKKNLVIGQYTDDTELSITLARNLIKNKGEYKRESVILDYIEWDNSGTPMRGKNTRALFDKIKTLGGYYSRYKKIFLDTDQKTHTQSNGSLMRCSPLSLIKGYSHVVEDCKITNPHPINQDACQIQIMAIRSALLGKTKDEILKLVQRNAQTDGVKEVIKQVVNKDKDRDLSVNKGWVLHGLYSSLFSLFHFEDPRKAIDWVIGSHPGSDSDTNSCIASALLGSFYGYNKLMEDPITKKNWELVRDSDPSKGDVPRDVKYQLKDFDDLCKDLCKISSI